MLCSALWLVGGEAQALLPSDEGKECSAVGLDRGDLRATGEGGSMPSGWH
jgi:hypothetical protein